MKVTAWSLRPSASPPEGSAEAEFVASLRETFSWCSARLSMWHLHLSLRSEELRPAELDEDGVLGSADAEVVRRLVERRREILHVRFLPPYRAANLSSDELGPETPLYLLCCYADESLWDGTSPPPTGGFLNDADESPWDTWIGAYEGAIVSLVPAQLVSAVQSAIDVNALGCIAWLGARDDAVNGLLRTILAPMRDK